MSIKIDKIRLEINKKIIELSPEEAKELKRVLEDLFGKDKQMYIPPYYPYRPHYPYWSVTCPTYANTSWDTTTCADHTVSLTCNSQQEGQ